MGSRTHLDSALVLSLWMGEMGMGKLNYPFEGNGSTFVETTNVSNRATILLSCEWIRDDGVISECNGIRV